MLCLSNPIPSHPFISTYDIRGCRPVAVAWLLHSCVYLSTELSIEFALSGSLRQAVCQVCSIELSPPNSLRVKCLSLQPPMYFKQPHMPIETYTQQISTTADPTNSRSAHPSPTVSFTALIETFMPLVQEICSSFM
jgi:hypothetical protein